MLCDRRSGILNSLCFEVQLSILIFSWTEESNPVKIVMYKKKKKFPQRMNVCMCCGLAVLPYRNTLWNFLQPC